MYSVPSRWQAGSKVQVRADRALVRIYIHNELIKTHERKPQGGRATDYNDYPDGKAPYAMRWPNFYCKRARELGPAIGDFTDQLLSGEFPWSRLRSAQKLLGLAERYGAPTDWMPPAGERCASNSSMFMAWSVFSNRVWKTIPQPNPSPVIKLLSI